MNLIDRQDAIDVIRTTVAEGVLADTLELRLNELDDFPLEIIRCKNCKWSEWYETDFGNKYCYCSEHGSSGHTENDFCSYAERNENERV